MLFPQRLIFHFISVFIFYVLNRGSLYFRCSVLPLLQTLQETLWANGCFHGNKLDTDLKQSLRAVKTKNESFFATQSGTGWWKPPSSVCPILLNHSLHCVTVLCGQSNTLIKCVISFQGNFIILCCGQLIKHAVHLLAILHVLSKVISLLFGRAFGGCSHPSKIKNS